MAVKILKVGKKAPASRAITKAAAVVKAGGLVVYPTETVYGLGADACSDEAVAKVFAAKVRPLESPISVAVSSIEMARQVAELTPVAETLLKKFAPGPLTVVVKAKPTVSKLLTSGTGKVGIRVPDHPAALRLIEFAGGPITTTSANVSGGPPPTTVKEALGQLGDKIDLALDAGRCELRTPSTVVDLSTKHLKILREGPITGGDIRKALRT
ncbi:MAG: L-threonylcarbamoyladenylate synthase [Hadesarchaea archaeon]|nr:L-threonylcarbamoyladenylate synthase [Hadesarchaea archaeon]